VINQKLSDIAWPQGTVVGAIVRESGEVIMAHHDLVVEPLDHLVLFVSDRTQVSAVEKLITPKKLKQ
jgi:trk system potassium uptake protein TrkA